MKKLISILSIAAILALVISACKSKPVTVTSPVKYEDTAGLAQFQSWKAMNERAEFEEYQAWKRGELAFLLVIVGYREDRARRTAPDDAAAPRATFAALAGVPLFLLLLLKQQREEHQQEQPADP